MTHPRIRRVAVLAIVLTVAAASSSLVSRASAASPPGPTQYTAIYSVTDELVQPALPTLTAALAPAPNASSIAVQDVCPERPVNHISMLDDAVVYAVVMRALASSNPLRASQINRSVCTQTTMPGVSVVQAVVGNATTYSDAAISFSQESGVHSEPAPASYVR